MRNNFAAIVDAAKNQDDVLLAVALEEGQCIDQYAPQSNHSAVTRLAMENNIAACEWLLAKGANINQAVLGAAYRGNKTYVNALLKRDASINFAAQGAASHIDQIEYANELIARGAHISRAVYGAAGYRETQFYAEELLSRGASVDNAAAGGHRALTNALLIKGANIDAALQGAARGAERELLEDLLSRGGDIRFALKGVTEEKNIPLVRELQCRMLAALGTHHAIDEYVKRDKDEAKYYHSRILITDKTVNRAKNTVSLRKIPAQLSLPDSRFIVSSENYGFFVLLASLSRYKTDANGDVIERYRDGKFKNTKLTYDIWMLICSIGLGMSGVSEHRDAQGAYPKRFIDRPYQKRLESIGDFFRQTMQKRQSYIQTLTPDRRCIS